MNGLQEIHTNDRKEVVIAYERATKKGDATLAANIRWAHPDLAKRFDQVDKDQTVNA